MTQLRNRTQNITRLRCRTQMIIASCYSYCRKREDRLRQYSSVQVETNSNTQTCVTEHVKFSRYQHISNT